MGSTYTTLPLPLVRRLKAVCSTGCAGLGHSDEMVSGGHCDQCGTPADPETRFCDGCGSPLPTSESHRRRIILAVAVAGFVVLAAGVVAFVAWASGFGVAPTGPEASDAGSDEGTSNDAPSAEDQVGLGGGMVPAQNLVVGKAVAGSVALARIRTSSWSGTNGCRIVVRTRFLDEMERSSQAPAVREQRREVMS